MRITGIVAEYNPLHSGHAYQIQKARENSDLVVVAMSGSFVQRGEIAGFDKYLRAHWAAEAGADLVAELPTAFVLQGARGFATGGVRTLLAAGANALSFGSENADPSLLERAAVLLAREDDDLKSAMHSAMKAGKSYAAAREDAFSALSSEDADVLTALRKPNFLLGAEYLRAVNAHAPGLPIVPVQRLGAGHDADHPNEGFSSASAIRKHLLAHTSHFAPLANALPPFVLSALGTTAIAQYSALEAVFLYALRCLTPEQALSLFGATEGLDRLLLAAADESTLERAWAVVKSKRYTLARIRRLFCAMLLDLKTSLVERANAAPLPYLHVLAFRDDARPLLRQLSDRAAPPLWQSKRDFDRLTGLAADLARLDVLATDVQALALDAPGKRDFLFGGLQTKMFNSH